MQDLFYALELRADIDAGLQDAKAGRVVELDQSSIDSFECMRIQ
jgi:predicted transcriptional regulator